ncbi:MAG TPA: hypothetical protein VJ957_02710 [Longimicrobiales bacterium]|nr:hypothetical protein [Longimicrobiales bacterium]
MMKRVLPWILAVGLVAGCGKNESDAPKQTLGSPSGAMPAANAQAQLDSANALFRSGDIEAARDHYRATTRIAPDLAAGWFGMYLSETRLGHKAAADSAALIVHRLAPELMQAPGMMSGGHPGLTDSISGGTKP